MIETIKPKRETINILVINRFKRFNKLTTKYNKLNILNITVLWTFIKDSVYLNYKNEYREIQQKKFNNNYNYNATYVLKNIEHNNNYIL